MKRMLLAHAFRFVDHVNFLVGTLNVRSQKAMEKIGGVRVGKRPAGAGRENYVFRISAPR